MKPFKTLCLMTTMLVMAAGSSLRADESMADIRNQVLQSVADKAQAELATVATARNKTIGILPLGGDSNHKMLQRLKSALTQAGFTVVEAHNDPLWDEIMREVEWGDRKIDIVDEATLVKFGSLKGVQVVLYGNLTEFSRSGRMVYAEIELHLSSLETRQHLWAGRFAARHYTASEMNGVVALDPLVRQALQAAVADATKTLAGARSLAQGRSAALLPLAGDMDDYTTGLISDAITSIGNLTLRNLDVRTLGEARLLLRDQPATADAILIGAVRDLTPRYLLHDELYQQTYKAEAEIQLSLQDAGTGDILWSGTGSGMVEEIEKEPTTSLVLRLVRNHPKVFMGIGVAIAFLIIVGWLFHVSRRVK